MDEGVTGKVFVEFYVEKDGSITHSKALKGISPECNQEAERVIAESPNWEPAIFDGQPVRIRMVMPIMFKTKS